jgi:type VI secretion system protein VasG
MSVSARSIVNRLNHTTRTAMEAAAGLCLSRTHYNVEIEHFLLKLLDAGNTDFTHLLRRYEIDQSRVRKELAASLDKLESGSGRRPALSPALLNMFTEAWTLGSLVFDAAEIRSGFAVLALVSTSDLKRTVREASPELTKIKADELQQEFQSIVAGSNENENREAPAAETSTRGMAAAPGKTPNLDQFTNDLTQHARDGKVDPVLGRDFEIRQVIDILMRRRQNNPILTGEAGVGKTAVVEGFAARLARGDVPPSLQNVSVRSLDLALLQAGAGVKGEFENRLKGLIAEVKASPSPIILFIDEAHTMIGAGGQAGQNDAANLLKPALARGELRTIAATTWSEYKRYFEKDAALARRFQVVKVDEPDEERCMVMLRGIVSSLEKHHNVRIFGEAVKAAVRLSHRYLVGRQLPDKAVSVLDTACARLSLGQNATPATIEDVGRSLDDLAVQERILRRESAAGANHTERLEAIAEQKKQFETQLASLQEKWRITCDLVQRMRQLRTQLEELAEREPVAAQAVAGGNGSGSVAARVAAEAHPDVLRLELERLSTEFEALQGDQYLTRACVDEHIVSEVISGWTGIPTGKMLRDEITSVLDLKSRLGERVIGQGHALELIAQRIATSRANLDDPGKPVGVFLLIGPSGVGKTETALALSDLLYGGERNLITINMSEFQEPHTVSTLKGSPPGYVGYGEGGVLTEAVRRRPYSVVLLDEVEKAHPDVLELFYQVFDKGVMEDGEGREIDFKNTIILLTTNACTDQMAKLCADPETAPGPQGMVKALKPELNKIFKPAFLGRLVIAPYYPVRDEVLKSIITLKLNKLRNRMLENHRLEFLYSPDVVDSIASRCTEVESGARNVDNILTNTLLPDMSRQLLGAIAESRRMKSIQVGIDASGAFSYT